MPRSLILSAYLATVARAERATRRRLARRVAEGKEDPERLDERFGRAGIERPEGRLVWFHAASVGEMLSLFELIRRLGERAPDAHFLVTTGTLTSARLFAARAPARAIHQFAPADTVGAVNAFLDHWRPDVAVWAESELWPAMLSLTHARGVPMLLVNARMSERSARRWRLFRGAARALLARFDLILAQDADTAARLERLGAPKGRVEVTGTLKEGAAPLPCDETERARLAAAIGGRPVWLAASTHPGEEAAALDAHRRILRAHQRALLIIAPRHPERGDEVAGLIAGRGFSLARRSVGELPARDSQVYLADTLGEMGLWYRLAPVSFVAGSLEPIGGHNPFEPAALGSAIIHGPHVANFADIYARLAEAGAALEVRDASELAQAVARALVPEQAAQMATAAWELCSSGAEVVDRVAEEILARLDRAAEPA